MQYSTVQYCTVLYITLHFCIHTVCCGFQFGSADSIVQYNAIECFIQTVCCGFQYVLQYGTLNLFYLFNYLLIFLHPCCHWMWQYNCPNLYIHQFYTKANLNYRLLICAFSVGLKFVQLWVQYNIIEYSTVLNTDGVLWLSVCINVWKFKLLLQYIWHYFQLTVQYSTVQYSSVYRGCFDFSVCIGTFNLLLQNVCHFVQLTVQYIAVHYSTGQYITVQ